MLLRLVSTLSAAAAADLAAPATGGVRLSSAPSVWLTEDVVSAAEVSHLTGALPTNEAAWSPCIGQVQEFASKRCTLLRVSGDKVLEAAVDKIGKTYGIEVAELRGAGLPIIRYLPGAPPVGVHGDIGGTGLVPNATLVLYLTDGHGGSGQTYFPAAGVRVTPRSGAVLSFANVDAAGAPDPAAKHGVGPVSADSPGDRLVIQVPVVFEVGGMAGVAKSEHVSGVKHKIHMGLMGGGLLAFGLYQLWQYDELYGIAALLALALGAGVLLVWKIALQGKPLSASDSAVEVGLESGEAECTLLVNGINCGGCKKSLAAALSDVDGVRQISIATKAETGVHPNKVVVSGGRTEAIREAVVRLDAGRGKFTIVDA